MKYKSELINEILETRGHETSSLHYESECVNTWIEENKGAYPKLYDYESEWLNYIVENPIGEFPYASLLNVMDATVENVVPYNYKSAILKGQTLANLLDKITVNVGANQENTHISINMKTTPKNGKYIMLYNVKQPTSSYNVTLGRCTPRIDLVDGTSLYHGYEDFNTTKGVKKWIFTANSDIKRVRFWINGNAEPILIEDFILLEYQEGMENWDIPYFEGMQSVQMPVLTTTGKNLFDKEAFYNDWKSKEETYMYKETVDGEDVLKVNNMNLLFADNKGFKISVKKGVPLTMSFKCKKAGTSDTKAVFSVRFSDTGFKDIGKCDSYEWIQSSDTFTPMRDYISVCSAYDKDDYYYVKDIQLEYDTQLTTYEPYKSNILTVNEGVTLRGIENVQDTLDCLTGEVVERIGEYTIDGSEDWNQYNGHNVEGYKSFITTITGLNNSYTGANAFISGDFKMESWLGYLNGTTEEMVWNHGPNKIGIRVKNESASNEEELKTFLASNPITFQYELATESIKTVELNVVNQDGNTLSKIKPIEGTMNLHTDGETIKPLFSGEIPVEAITQNLSSFIGE